MNLEQLIDQFELVTDTEEGLAKLRKVVLNQAVRGNLTKSDPDDKPGEKLLERIEAKRQSLYEIGEIRKPKSIEPGDQESILYDLPQSWIWCNLGDVILEIYGGSTPSKSNPRFWEGDIYWASVKDLDDESIYLESTLDKITEEGLNETKFVPAGNVIVCTRMGLGKINLNTVDTTINQDLKSIILPDELLKLYFYYYYKSLEIKGSGMTVSGIKQSELLRLPFALPSKNEQKRIVKKIETFFSQVDELEQKVHQDREVDERLQVAVLDDLQRAETPEASRQSWKRLTDHFEQIYRKPEHIEQLKQAILNEAVRGRLVPRDPNDEPAEKLLERIKEEKQRLYKEGEIRKPKDLPEIADEEIPYELPEGWTWCRFGKTALQISDVNHKMPDEVKKGIPYVSPSDFYGSNEIDFAGAKKISQKSFDELSKKIRPELNDLIFPRYGTIGVKNRLVNTEIDFLASYSCAIIKNLKGYIDPKYTYYYSVSPLIQADIELHTNKTTQPNVGINSIKEFRFPLPPYTEQNRIVNRIEEFFIWCDDLKVKLSRAQQTDQRLLEALVNGHAEG